MNDNEQVFLNKFFYNVMCLVGVVLLVFTGIYYGYTYKENEKYFESRDIQYVQYINTKFLYHNITYTNDKDYSNIIAGRIFNITIILGILGMLFLEYGYRNSLKYKYSTSLKERIKNLYKSIKEYDKNEEKTK